MTRAWKNVSESGPNKRKLINSIQFLVLRIPNNLVKLTLLIRGTNKGTLIFLIWIFEDKKNPVIHVSLEGLIKEYQTFSSQKRKIWTVIFFDLRKSKKIYFTTYHEDLFFGLFVSITCLNDRKIVIFLWYQFSLDHRNVSCKFSNNYHLPYSCSETLIKMYSSEYFSNVSLEGPNFTTMYLESICRYSNGNFLTEIFKGVS